MNKEKIAEYNKVLREVYGMTVRTEPVSGILDFTSDPFLIMKVLKDLKPKCEYLRCSKQWFIIVPYTDVHPERASTATHTEFGVALAEAAVHHIRHGGQFPRLG